MPGESAETWLKTLHGSNSHIEFVICGYTHVETNWGFTNRILDDYLVYFTTKGVFGAKIENRREEILPPGSFLMLPPKTLHTFRLLANQKPISVFHTRFRLLNGKKPIQFTGSLLLKNAWYLHENVRSIQREFRRPRPLRMERLKSRLFLLFSDVFMNSPTGRPGMSVLSASRQEAVSACLEKSQSSRTTMNQLSEAAGLTVDYFARVFRKTYGTSPRLYLVRERFNRIAECVIETKEPIMKIAERFGYEDIYQFSKLFKKIFGLSPRYYREKYGGSAASRA